MTAIAPISPAALADLLATDARTTRKFLRSITPEADRPGKGARWEIKGTKANIASLTKKFAAFNEAEATAKADRAAKAEAKVTEAPAVDEAPEVEVMTDDEGPSDEELLAIDDEVLDDIEG